VGYPAQVRKFAQRRFPAMIADRARRYERRFRHQQGVTTAAQRLIEEGGAGVRSGPFAGMLYPPNRIADVDTPSAKLLGVYEREIQRAFVDALKCGVSIFVDIGCADGYYAVGMPFASRAVTCYAFDLAASARRLCGEVARLNSVQSRVRIAGRFTAGALDGVDMDGALVLCDIEGAEGALFGDPLLLRRVHNSTVVIEVHEDAHPGMSRDLQRQFVGSHRIERVEQEPRSDDLLEFRPPLLHWLICAPRR
jgi:hypothetical protein